MSQLHIPGFVDAIPDLDQALRYVPLDLIARRAGAVVEPIVFDAPYDNDALQLSRAIREYPTAERRPTAVRLGVVAGTRTVQFNAVDGQPFQIEDQLDEGAPRADRGSGLYVWPDRMGDDLPTELTYTRHTDGYWMLAPSELVMSADTPGYVDSILFEKLNRFGGAIGLALARRFMSGRRPRKA